ncbi:redoxin domain-containing protein [Symmachiella dynata]|uniref:redoxin domain-containing protein n=1 Tax=Symmachiella dynata TaxID=2527995 RepID=UPI0030EE74F0
MGKVISKRLLLCLVVVTISVPALGAESAPAKSVEDFKLRSHLGREWSLSDFADKKVVVITFLGTECPLAKLYGPRLTELQQQFADQSVAFIGINSNTQDSNTELSNYAERYKIRFPLLKDVGNHVADAMQAERTPEVFVLDKDRKVRYHGRIDNQYGVGVSRDTVQRHHVAVAVEELLAGKPVSLPKTKPVGCYIGRVKKSKPTGDITYSNHIAAIFNKRCVECHRDGEIAPFPLTSYDDVIGWEETIVEVIEDQRMPPWFANPAHGEFRNDARLSKEEKSLIYKWVKNGMPEGDPAELPDPPKFTEGWRIPKPDQVFHMREEPFTVPAQGVVDYQYFVVETGWDEDKYIYAAEARPDNTSVVHHILVYIIPPGEREQTDARDVLVGYAPGSTPVQLRDGIALKVPAGSRLLFQMHYTPNGYEQHDRSYAGVCFIDKKDVTKLRKGRLAINTRFRIPPNTDNHSVTAEYEFHRDESLLAMTPHMHLRGKSFRYEAIYPDGKKEVLLDVPKYDFNWQLKYILDKPKRIPKGTTIHCTALFDNSKNNPANPDPDKKVRWGDQSWEEMMIGFFDTIPIEENNQPKLSKNVEIDPSGEWSWERRAGLKMVEESLSLKLEGNKLSGVLNTQNGPIEIEDAVVDGRRITFQVKPAQFRGAILAFDAQIDTAEIKGQATFTIEKVGKSQSFPWVARRSETTDKKANK